MRTITIEKTLYKFDELSDKAKDHARERYAEWHWSEDSMSSLQGFLKYFGVKLNHWEFDFYNCSHSSWKIDPGEWEAEEIEAKLKPLRDASCPFTGYCADHYPIDSILKDFDAGERDMKTLLNSAIEAWLYACQKEVEYAHSEEAFREDCEANEWEFDERGNLA